MRVRDLRVLVDATTWWNDRGFGRYTRSLLTAMVARRRGLEYTFLVDREPDGTIPESVRITWRKTRRTLTESAVGDGARGVADLFRVARGALLSPADVVFFPTVYSFLPLPSSAPFVVGFHDTTAERLPELVFPSKRNAFLWNAKVSLARRTASRFLTVSEASAGDLGRVFGIPPDRIDVVYGAPDPIFRVLAGPDVLTRGRLEYGFRADSSLFVYVGGLNPHKNVSGLLRAFESLIGTHQSSELAIVGDTSRRGFHDNVDELTGFVAARPELASRVRFLGRVPDEPLVRLLNAATALVFPSFSEGFGLPAVEAMACGLPVLASGATSLPEIIQDAGLFFDPSNPSEIRRVMSEIIESPELRAKLRERGLRRARELTWERSAERAETMLRWTAASGRPPLWQLLRGLRSPSLRSDAQTLRLRGLRRSSRS